MDDLLKYYYSSHYTPLGSSFFALLSSCLIIFKKNVPSRLIIFKYYCLAYFLNSFSGALAFTLREEMFIIPIYIIDHSIDYAFTFFEFYVIAKFLKPDLSKKLFNIGSIIFYTVSLVLFCLGFLLETRENYFYLQTIFNIQACIILIFCWNFFSQFFKVSQTDIQISTFWIVTGISILMLGTLPFTLVSHHILILNHPDFGDLFSIIYILYSIMFLTFILGIISHKSFNNQRQI